MSGYVAWSVEIKCVNDDGVVYDNLLFAKDRTDICRLILTYKPKRGYEIVALNIEQFEGLV